MTGQQRTSNYQESRHWQQISLGGLRTEEGNTQVCVLGHVWVCVYMQVPMYADVYAEGTNIRMKVSA